MKAVLTFKDAMVSNILKAIEMVSAVAGEDVAVELINDDMPIVKPMRGRGATVQYRAIAGAEALMAIGEHTVRGIIYAHLLACGPCTEKDIRVAKKGSYTRKSVESVLHQLKTMGVVVGQPIPASALPPPPAPVEEPDPEII